MVKHVARFNIEVFSQLKSIIAGEDDSGLKSMADHKVAIINVGSNTSHGSLRSPLFSDGTFEFVPIPDDQVEDLPTYADFKTQGNRAGSEFIPERRLTQTMHDDPEFLTNTYGDNPEYAGRAKNLMKLIKGDSLFYLARLVEWDEQKGWGRGSFYLIGDLVLDHVVRKADLAANPGLAKTVENNAHVRRWLLNPHLEPRNFGVFVGSDHSARYLHAVPFDGDLMVQVLRKADGSPIAKKEGTTDNYFVGCNTRACRIIESPPRMNVLREHIAKYR